MRVFVLLSMIFIASLAFAMEVPVTLEKLTHDSDRIVRGKVMSLAAHKGSNEYGDELIYTDVVVRTDEALKGDRSQLKLTVEGGTLEGVTLAVSDTPEFHVGEEIIVFARKDVTGFRPTYRGQSKYTVSSDGMIRPKSMHYNEFKRQVLSAVEKERRK
jgi:hypothetical protein